MALARMRNDFINLGVEDDVGDGSRPPAVSTNPRAVIRTRPSYDNRPLFTVIPIRPARTITVRANGLALKPLPNHDYPNAFVVPANTLLYGDARTPDGWLHLISKSAPGHVGPEFYGWVRPGTVSDK
jgi:hypothetical protein